MQSDPAPLRRLVEFAALPPGSRVLDAGCGRGLVAEAFLEAGHVVRAIRAHLRPGGPLVVCDHTTDPACAAWHQEVERARDTTHTRNLTPGELVDLLAAEGLREIATAEEAFSLDLDEWFGRGTPSCDREGLLRLLAGRAARGFEPRPRADGGTDCARGPATVSGARVTPIKGRGRTAGRDTARSAP